MKAGTRAETIQPPKGLVAINDRLMAGLMDGDPHEVAQQLTGLKGGDWSSLKGTTADDRFWVEGRFVRFMDNRYPAHNLRSAAGVLGNLVVHPGVSVHYVDLFGRPRYAFCQAFGVELLRPTLEIAGGTISSPDIMALLSLNFGADLGVDDHGTSAEAVTFHRITTPISPEA